MPYPPFELQNKFDDFVSIEFIKNALGEDYKKLEKDDIMALVASIKKDMLQIIDYNS